MIDMSAMNPFTFYLILTVALIGTELLIFQVSIFWFLFVGLGALVATLVAWLIPDASWLLTTAVFVVSSGMISVSLFKPLKNLQSKKSTMAGNDAVGQTVMVKSAIEPGKSGKVVWSGTDWKASLAAGETASLQDGDEAVIVALEGIRMTVAPKR